MFASILLTSSSVNTVGKFFLRFDRIGAIPRFSVISDTISAIKEDLTEIGVSLRNRSIEAKELPDVWALSFIASICVVIAQSIYQIGVPSIVRAASMREYINTILDQEMKMQSEFAGVDKNEVRELIINASSEYEEASVANFNLCVASFMLYLSAVLIISYIVITQTIGVVRAAGWI